MKSIPFSLSLALSVFLVCCSLPSKKYSGIVSLGHEARSVRLCGQNELLWIHVPMAQRQELEKLARAELNKGFYLEFRGRMITPPGAFAKEYSGSIEVVEIFEFKPEPPPGCGGFP